MFRYAFKLALTCAIVLLTRISSGQVMEEFPVPTGSRPHDVAPAVDGGVWYTAQDVGALGWLDPATGRTRHIRLGRGSRPHGVIVGPDDAPWITDGGLNAIVRVDPETDEVHVFPLPSQRRNANLNTATFDHSGRLWFTGQNGVYGRLDPATGDMDVFDAPRGRGPYGIATAPNGDVYYASLAGNYVGRIDLDTGQATVLEPPTSNQGARRVWPDSQGRIWVSEWNAGQVAVYDPNGNQWREWKLPGARPSAYAVYVDETDKVWLSDFSSNSLVRFDPDTERFESFPLPSQPSDVRQLLGRPGELWAPESAGDQLVVVRYATQPIIGDFDQNGMLDAHDIDLLTAQVTSGNANLSFDLDENGTVDQQDRVVWVTDLKRTYFGDSNLDGQFSTADLVSVFQSGQYEDPLNGNSTWATGDWNGDTDFDTGDLVLAFQSGAYEQGPRAEAVKIPEPHSCFLSMFGWLLLFIAGKPASGNCRKLLESPASIF
jgi:virginiamycin B lyase